MLVAFLVELCPTRKIIGRTQKPYKCCRCLRIRDLFPEFKTPADGSSPRQPAATLHIVNGGRAATSSILLLLLARPSFKSNTWSTFSPLL